MLEVIKRNGDIVDFDLRKISGAIEKAFRATEKSYTQEVIELLTLRVAADFQDHIDEDRIDVETIQDSAERVLANSGYGDVAKAYILYRKHREKMRTMKSTFLDFRDVINSYVKVEDWRVQADERGEESIGNLILGNAGAITANYWLSEIYDEEIAAAHRSGEIHLHDLSMLTGCSAGWSLKQLICEGISGIPQRPSFRPARHLTVLCNQMVNFLSLMQNEWAGAQTFSSFDTWLAPYVKADELTYAQVHQCIESFVYGINIPGRWGTTPPCTNLVLDWRVPSDLADHPALVGGKEQEFTYSDCQKEMDLINRALLEVMTEGDANGFSFPYPLLTYAVTENFGWGDTVNNRLLFEMTAREGTPYFANYIRNGRESSEVRAGNTRLYLDPRMLQRKTGGYLGAGENTGTVGKVTINLPRIAYLSVDQNDFFARLDHLMDLSARSLKIKRGLITRLLNEGLYPYTKRYLGSFDDHFSSIGVIGMNEACLNANWVGQSLTHPKASQFAEAVLVHMRNRLADYQEKYGDLYSLEATMAESSISHLARLDKELYPGIRTSSDANGKPYYTDSSLLPANSELDLYDALDIQDVLQPLYTSGTVFQAVSGADVYDWRAVADQVHEIAENYKLPYFRLVPEDELFRTESSRPEPDADEMMQETLPAGEDGQMWFDEDGQISFLQVETEDSGVPEHAQTVEADAQGGIADQEIRDPNEQKPGQELQDAGGDAQLREEEAAQPGRISGNAENGPEKSDPEPEHAEPSDPVLAEIEQNLVENLEANLEEHPVEYTEKKTVSEETPKLTFFTARNSPGCMIVKQLLKEIPHDTVDAYEHPEKAREHHVTQVPALVVKRGEDCEQIEGMNAIRQFLEGSTWKQS